MGTYAGRDVPVVPRHRSPGAGRARHRSVRPRYGRMLSALVSVGVTGVALLGATGVLPERLVGPDGSVGAAAAAVVLPEPAVSLAGWSTPSRMRRPELPVPDPEALPPDSGTGRRVVFDMSSQRVWLVGAGDRVRRSYLVSGSVTDNLRPGTYTVYSTSRHAIGIDDSGTMEYMVRFAHGERAAIGFHDIPVDEGRLVQTRADLGTPQSHGCIRQWRPDARALWDFAPVGTTVVVTA